MAQYEKGDYVKFEMTHEQSGEREWVWLSVDNSSDEQQVVFGQLDSEPVVATDVKWGDTCRELCASPRAQKSLRFSNGVKHHFTRRNEGECQLHV